MSANGELLVYKEWDYDTLRWMFYVDGVDVITRVQ